VEWEPERRGEAGTFCRPASIGCRSGGGGGLAKDVQTIDIANDLVNFGAGLTIAD
jgi:hypothetical protein